MSKIFARYTTPRHRAIEAAFVAHAFIANDRIYGEARAVTRDGFWWIEVFPPGQCARTFEAFISYTADGESYEFTEI